MEHKIFTDFLKSSPFAMIKKTYGWSDEQLNSDSSYPNSLFHFHGGTSPGISWNDVQEIMLINKYAGLPIKIDVPLRPTEGYNQHGHTSEFDGGSLPGITGNHDHRNSMNGGFSYSVMYPSTGVPQADWES